CRGVVLIEASKNSGAMITCEFALSQDREVFVVPGNIFSSNFRGNHMLIKNGAKLVEDINDILEEFEEYKAYTEVIIDKNNNCMERKPYDGKEYGRLNQKQRKVLSEIDAKPKSIEEISISCGYKIQETIGILSLLKLRGFIEEKSFGMYNTIF
ncbi:MAG: DNA-processing protein DprA, partial [Actinobacteria bacterium]|nr:DNA-processing protein DprA [Actinomycetota bacterium]